MSSAKRAGRGQSFFVLGWSFLIRATQNQREVRGEEAEKEKRGEMSERKRASCNYVDQINPMVWEVNRSMIGRLTDPAPLPCRKASEIRLRLSFFLMYWNHRNFLVS